MEKAIPDHLSISLSAQEKEFILRAAKAAGAENASSYARDVLLQAAGEALGEPHPVVARDWSTEIRMKDIVRCTIKGADGRGDTKGHVVLASIRRFGTTFSDQNRAVLRYLGKHPKRNVHELSRETGYSYTNLSTMLRAMAAYDIVTYGVETGRTRYPSLACRKVFLDLPLAEGRGRRPLTIGFRSSPAERTIESADIVLESMREFIEILPDRAYQLLKLIAAHKPESGAELAKLTGSSAANTYPLLRRLHRAGLVELREEGKLKVPRVEYSSIRVGLVFS